MKLPVRLIAAAAVLSALLFPRAIFADSKASALLHSLQEKFTRMSSCAGDFMMSLRGFKDTRGYSNMSANGRIYVEGDSLRMETRMNVVDQQNLTTMVMKGMFVLSHNVLWETVTMVPASAGAPFVGKMNVDALKKQFPHLFGNRDFVNFFNPAATITQLNPKQVRLLGSTYLPMSKMKAYELESPPRLLSEAFDFPMEDPNNIPAQLKVWVGERDGVAYRTTMADRTGKVVMRFSFSSIRKNPRLSRSLFEYSPPKGAQIVDMTPLMTDMIHRALNSKSSAKKGEQH